MRIVSHVLLVATVIAAGSSASSASPSVAEEAAANATFTQYFFGGAVGHGFVPPYGVGWVDDTRYAILNPGEVPASVVNRFTRGIDAANSRRA